MQQLWEILVPTVRNVGGFYSTRYHKVWDKKVRDITNGLSILPPIKGHWVSPCNELFVERMIPVRIACTLEQIHEIGKMTKQYYSQQAVLYYKVSEEVYIV